MKNKSEIFAELLMSLSTIFNIICIGAIFIIYMLLFVHCIPYINNIFIFMFSGINSEYAKFTIEVFAKVIVFFGGFYLFVEIINLIVNLTKGIFKKDKA